MHHINHLLMWTVLTVYQLFICTYQTCVENGSLLCLVYIYSCLSMIPDHYYDYHEYCKMMMRWLFKCWIKNLFYIFLFFKWLKGFQNFSVVINIDLCKNKVFLNYLKIAKFCVQVQLCLPISSENNTKWLYSVTYISNSCLIINFLFDFYIVNT